MTDASVARESLELLIRKALGLETVTHSSDRRYTSDGADVGTSATIHAVGIGKNVEEIMRTVKLHREVHRHQTFYPVFAPNQL